MKRTWVATFWRDGNWDVFFKSGIGGATRYWVRANSLEFTPTTSAWMQRIKKAAK